MRTVRFHCRDLPGPGEQFTLSAAESHHALKVLRLRTGAELCVLDGCGTKVHAELVRARSAGRRSEVVCVVRERQAYQAPKLRVRLCVAPPRGRGMHSLIRAATELGVNRITPVLCRYGVAKPAASATVPAAWTAEAVAALKQSGNVFLPALDPLRPLKAVAAETDCGCFGAAPAATGADPRPAAMPGAGDFALWIGPEGGFDNAEQAILRGCGLQPLTVGGWTLRLLTAVPALLGCILGKVADDSLRCQHT